MKKIVFICPYFGKLPATQMKFWLKSCEKNSTIDWLIITDDKTKYDYPDNVTVKYMSFNDMKKIIKSKFEYNASLESAYKLCDYKPMYGYIFNDLITNYDYWGHCDMTDCIFGDIRNFITSDILNKYDKIGFLGHMTIYKNSEKVNERFFLKTNSKVTLKEIIESPNNYAFDELNDYSINQIYLENNYNFLRVDGIYTDISCMSYNFKTAYYDENFKRHLCNYIPFIFLWREGKLYKIYLENNEICTKEFCYVHYQKRKMDCTDINILNCSEFYITPFGFECFDDSELLSKLKKYSKNKLIYMPFIKNKYKALKYRIRKFVERR